MTIALGQKFMSVLTEKKMIGKEVFNLRRDKGISYHQIMLNTGIESRIVKKIEDGGGYHIDSYLLVIKFLKHGQSKFRPQLENEEV